MARSRASSGRSLGGPRSVNLRRPRLAKWLDALRSSYWFVPALCVVACCVLAAVAVRIDRVGAVEAERFPEWIRFREPDAARSFLMTIAGAMVTIVSLTFSISVVALTLASSQFGARLLDNFMRDRPNQAILGLFLGTFAYCLIVLVSVRSGQGAEPPQVALSLALALSLTGICVLIFFLHHMAESIQATNVVQRVGAELREVIERTLPEADDERPASRPTSEPEGGRPVPAPRSGTLQAVDGEALVELACERDLELWMACRPGDPVIEGAAVARVHGVERVDDELADAVAGALVLGGRRTLVQDVEFAFCQLVEIAVRALSPGINDPFTAMSCLDALGEGLVRVARRGPMLARLDDDDGHARVHLDVTDFVGMVATAFDQIREHAQRDLAVTLYLLETLRRIGPMMRTPEQRAALRHQGRLARELGVAHAGTDADRGALEERLLGLERVLAAAAAQERTA